MKRIRLQNAATRAYYVLPGKNSGQLPIRAQLLSVSYDEQERVAITFAVNPDSDKGHERTFYVIAQGERIPVHAGQLLYVGSARLPGRPEWHVFEVDSPEERDAGKAMRGSVSNINTGPVSGTSLMIGSMGGDLVRHGGGVHIQ